MSGYTAVTIAAVGAVTSAAGAIQQGNASKAAAQRNAAMMERNAGIARQQGAAAAAKQEREARIRAGAARAGKGGSGVTLDSFGDLLEANAKVEKQDELTILYNAELQAQSGELSAANERMSGDAAQSAGYMGAAGSLLKGAGSVWAGMPDGGGGTSVSKNYGKSYTMPNVSKGRGSAGTTKTHTVSVGTTGRLGGGV